VEEIDDLCGQLVRGGVASCVSAGWTARRDGRWELSVGGATRLHDLEAACDGPASRTEPLFDLASVTKPITAVAVARSGIDRKTPLVALLAEARGTPSEDATLELLLAHRAGLEAHVPLYRALAEGGPFDREAALHEALRCRRADARGAIPPDGFPPLYSDLGYLLVGEALRRRAGEEARREVHLDDELARLVTTPLGLDDALGSARRLAERLGGEVAFRARTAPTEVVAWRDGEIRGAVHDENAWAFGGEGACGHAGLFGTVSAVLRFGQDVLEGVERGELAWLVEPRQGGDLRAGFDGKSESGSSAGERAGPRTFGHLGFTGTSLWIDPDASAAVVLLTNRVHPTRENLAIRSARPEAHDALFALAAAAPGR